MSDLDNVFVLQDGDIKRDFANLVPVYEYRIHVRGSRWEDRHGNVDLGEELVVVLPADVEILSVKGIAGFGLITKRQSVMTRIDPDFDVDVHWHGYNLVGVRS